MPKSQARESLAGHHQKIADAVALREAARRPVLEARDRLSAGRVELNRAEAELARAHSAEVEAVLENDGKRQAADKLLKAGEATARAQAAVDRCRRVVAALEVARHGIRSDVR